MRKLVPMTMVAIAAFAAPAFAQDDDGPDLERWVEKLEKMVEQFEEMIQPLLEEAERLLQSALQEVERWLDDVDLDQLFGEFDFERWMKELERMLDGLGEDGDEDGDEFVCGETPGGEGRI